MNGFGFKAFRIQVIILIYWALGLLFRTVELSSYFILFVHINYQANNIANIIVDAKIILKTVLSIY